MNDPGRVKIIITGRVQGVSFRDFTRRKALSLGISGWVRNLPDGRSVEVEAEGDRGKLEELTKLLKQGPPLSTVQETMITWGTYSGEFEGFLIKH